MQTKDYYFDLPEHLIAKYPLKTRSASRLLHYQRNTQSTSHHTFSDLPDLLKKGDLLVLNNTKVIKARLFGHKETGGKIELLVERVISQHQFIAHIKASKAPKPDTKIILAENFSLAVIEKKEDVYICESNAPIYDILSSIGHVPLPPYMHRTDEESDFERYQTVYAKFDGSVAAPTAGLHFDTELFNKLSQKGIEHDFVTLHVGAGTFMPVKVQDLASHQMHSEWFEVSQNLVDKINQTKQNGGRVIAVGTTALRSLESAAKEGDLKAGSGDTDIFIYPGYNFKVIDGLITNFHLPESTLIMLVSALIGRETTLSLYQCAIELSYRFYSYGDASLLI